MKREDIIARLKENDSTILSFPDRGPWGDSSYRGNCSGWIQAFLIWKYQVKKFAELFAGSGTGSDVCKDMGITYIGADLNPKPVRSDILIVNAITDEVPEEFYGADMVFMHPPYGEEIKIPYAGSMWEDTNNQKNYDLGQMKWDIFMKELNSVIMKYYASMKPGARMSVLMGDVRRNGLHSMLTDIVKPGELDQIIIKAQHNTMSDRKWNGSQKHKSFVPLVHEYIMVVKKPEGLSIEFVVPVKNTVDIRDSKCSTWKDVVYAVIKKLGTSDLNGIYREIESHEKTNNNPHWKEKIRQTLQMSSLFVSPERGVWALA